jgi:hypothetical protein
MNVPSKRIECEHFYEKSLLVTLFIGIRIYHCYFLGFIKYYKFVSSSLLGCDPKFLYKFLCENMIIIARPLLHYYEVNVKQCR